MVREIIWTSSMVRNEMTSSSSMPSDDHRPLLDAVDWNFPGAATEALSVHALHWYPGNFIAQIPAYLIQILSKPKDWVLDPFCGSGTTGVEAVRLGRNAYECDVSAAAVHVAQGKMAAAFEADARFFVDLAGRLIWDLTPATGDSRPIEGHDPELRHWLHPDTHRALLEIWATISTVPPGPERRVAELIFTDVLFACVSTRGANTRSGKTRRHHWGWVADNVRPVRVARHDARGLFRDRCMRAADTIVASGARPGGEWVLRREDARAMDTPEGQFALAVTSPPYPFMIDYSLANRITYLWMGWSLERDREGEIGTRRSRDRSSGPSRYLGEMRVAAERIRRALRPGGHLAIVLGASRGHPDLPLAAVAEFQGFDIIWGPRVRVPSRRRVADRSGSTQEERIWVLRRSG